MCRGQQHQAPRLCGVVCSCGVAVFFVPAGRRRCFRQRSSSMVSAAGLINSHGLLINQLAASRVYVSSVCAALSWFCLRRWAAVMRHQHGVILDVFQPAMRYSRTLGFGWGASSAGVMGRRVCTWAMLWLNGTV